MKRKKKRRGKAFNDAQRTYREQKEDAIRDLKNRGHLLGRTMGSSVANMGNYEEILEKFQDERDEYTLLVQESVERHQRLVIEFAKRVGGNLSDKYFKKLMLNNEITLALMDAVDEGVLKSREKQEATTNPQMEE
jgi:hypothetical protein